MKKSELIASIVLTFALAVLTYKMQVVVYHVPMAVTFLKIHWLLRIIRAIKTEVPVFVYQLLFVRPDLQWLIKIMILVCHATLIAKHVQKPMIKPNVLVAIWVCFLFIMCLIKLLGNVYQTAMQINKNPAICSNLWLISTFLKQTWILTLICQKINSIWFHIPN